MSEIALVPVDDRILMDDHPLLRERSAEVTAFLGQPGGDYLPDLACLMMEILRERAAWGLAAVQLGVPKRVIAVRLDSGGALVAVNPVVTRTLRREAVDREGCLSVPPARWRNVSRSAKCELTWQWLDGLPASQGFSGREARIIQHEVDHLDGILITDKPPA